jgi:hypothetical protein
MTSRLALATTAGAIVIGNVTGASAQTDEVTKLASSSAFHGVHGLEIDKSGRLFAGSVAGAPLDEVDRSNSTAKIAVPSPKAQPTTSHSHPTAPWRGPVASPAIFIRARTTGR